MIRSINTINKSMNVLQKKQENTSANIANVNTPGFKFQDIIQRTQETNELINYVGGNDNEDRQVLGNFVFGNEIDEYYKNFKQGILIDTGSHSDFALVGNGFFTIELDDGGLAFSRNGNFKVNEFNQLVTMEGYNVLGVNEFGQPTNINIVNDEIININFLISDFPDYQELISIGDTLFTSQLGGNQVIEGEVKQGFLEQSNVEIANELVRMIEITREFEANQKLLHSADETLSKAVNEIGRV